MEMVAQAVGLMVDILSINLRFYFVHFVNVLDYNCNANKFLVFFCLLYIIDNMFDLE